MNSVFISGNLTRDPEVRTTATGKTFATFAVAVNGREKNAAGEYQDRAEFVDCVAFGYQAERLAANAVKGTEVVVSGRLRYTTWEKNGEKRSRLEVTAEDLKIVPKPTPKPADPEVLYFEDVPF